MQFKAVVNCLRRALAGTKKQWTTALPYALYTLNDLPGVVQEHSPHKIVFGRDPIGLGDVRTSGKHRSSVDCDEWFEHLSKHAEDKSGRIWRRIHEDEEGDSYPSITHQSSYEVIEFRVRNLPKEGSQVRATVDRPV